jgi:hypothetical protein
MKQRIEMVLKETRDRISACFSLQLRGTADELDGCDTD